MLKPICNHNSDLTTFEKLSNLSSILILLFLFSFLSACGGGNEPSNLLISTGGNVGGEPPPAPAPTTTTSNVDITVMSSVQEIVPSGGSAMVRLITFEKFDATDANAQLVTAPNVTFSVTVTGAATLENVPKNSNQNGEAVFSVSHPGNETVLVTVKGTGRYVGGFSFPIYFGGSVSAKVLTTGNVPADGKTPAKISVFARDWAGIGISGISVNLSFSSNSFAVSNSTANTTQSNGELTIEITNTVAQTVKVTPIIGGMAAAPLTLNFDTTLIIVPPAALDMLIKQDNVIADGKAEAAIVIVARDIAGTPIPNVPVSIRSDSATAVMKIGEATNTLFIKGNTGTTGSFELIITDPVPETVNLNASTTSSTTNANGEAQSITLEVSESINFIEPVVTPEGVVIDKIELDAAINNDQQANGTDVVSIRGRVYDKNSVPVPMQKVSIIVSGGSAKIQLVNDGDTDSSGRFFASFTDDVVEEFTVKAVIGEVSSDTIKVRFVAIPPPVVEPGETETLPTPPKSITLLATPDQQMVDDGSQTNYINLTASVRDANNTPMAGIKVRISASANTAIFDAGQQETGAGGTASFKVSNTNEGSFTVTATAWVEDSKGNVVGSPVTDSHTVTFYTARVDTVGKLTVSVVNNKQPASGQDPVRIDVIARDSQGRAMAGVPIAIQMGSAVALVNPARGETDDNGYFSTEITSTQAGEVSVTVAVEGSSLAHPPVTVTFVAQTGGSLKPATVEIQAVNAPQPADGKSKVTLVVIPRDINGSPLSGVDVKLLSNSDNVIFAQDTGTTNPLGEFRTTIISEVAETVSITPVAAETVLGKPITVTFTPAGIGVSELLVTVTNDNQPATGKDEDAIQINVIARDGNGKPLDGIPISVQLSKGSLAIAKSETEVTDKTGLFVTRIISSVAGQVGVTIAIPNTAIIHPPVIVTFKPVAGITTPTTIETRLEPPSQPADGKSAITLVVIPRDSQGTPMSGLTINLITESLTVQGDSSGLTNDLGEARFPFTNTVAETVKITPVAKSSPEAPGLVGAPVFLSFVPLVSNATELVATVVNDRQVATGKDEDAIQINVIARDLTGHTLPGVPIVVQLPGGSTAIAKPFQGETAADNGVFTTQLTSSVAGEVLVTITVKDTNVLRQVVATFTTEEKGVQPTTVEITEVRNTPQPADGKSPITVVVIPRSQDGAPIPGVNVEFVTDSNQLTIEPGVTNALGQYQATVTSETAGTFAITPVAWQEGQTKIVGQPSSITFLPIGSAVVEITEVRNAPQPADGKSAITIVVTPRGQDGQPMPGINIDFAVDPNQLTMVGGKTNALGQYQTVVTSNTPGTFTITPIAWADGQEATKTVGKATSITFLPIGSAVADLTVTVVNDKQPATGKDENAIQIDVVARDSGGRPVAGVPIVVQLPTGAVAVAKVSDPAITDSNGYFSTQITSTEAGEVAVTIAIKDTPISRPPVIITFVAQAGITPTVVELLILNAPQPADDKSAITLVVIPRDAKGMPVAGVPISLIHDSNTAKFASESGMTNALGEFRTTVTNTVAETFNITPVAAEGAILGPAVPVTFTPVAIPIPASLTLTVEYATGEEGQQVGQNATLTVFAYNENHAPLENVPVTLTTAPGDEPPDVSSTAKFDDTTGAAGVTGKNGTFVTTISNSQAGTFIMVAKVTGTSLSSNTVKVSFTTGKTTAPEISDISLITNYPQLGSNNKNAGNTDGATITAILKNKDNNLVEGAVVNFSADSGEIRPIQIEGSTANPGVTDTSGRAQALLTTLGNFNNRTITVTASVSTATGEVKTATIPIRIVGTSIKVEGGTTLIMGGISELAITLTDSGEAGIPNEILKVESSLGNSIDNPSPTTNANGQAKVKVTATVAGQDIITVSKDGATAATLVINISDHDFTLAPVPETADISRIPLNTPQEFVVRWKKGGVPQALQKINLSATRGILPGSVTTDINGEARFSITADNAGPSIVRASAEATDGPSRQIDVNFVATRVASMTLQADPSTIGVNTPGAPSDIPIQQSQIITILRDANNNLVEGRIVNFNLIDNTGGSLSPTSNLTDRYGQANTVYTAGASPSASGGVLVMATVDGEPNIYCTGGESVAAGNGCSVKLTVALKRAFISLGTGNKVFIKDEVTYQYPYKALATDINGAPIPDTEIVLSVVPKGYLKGYYESVKDEGWSTIITAPLEFGAYCLNEDVNRNGLLDEGEDRNKNGHIDPGGITTFSGGANSSVEGSTVKIKTGGDGYAGFDILYAKEMANWVIIELTARSTVSGSEDSTSVEITLTGAAEDFKDPKIAPPGRQYPDGYIGSPFGLGAPAVIDNTKTPPVVSFPSATCDNDL